MHLTLQSPLLRLKQSLQSALRSLTVSLEQRAYPSHGLVAPCPRDSQTITRDGCGWYTSYYCEENVLRLYKSLADDATAAGVELHVVFVSNVARQVPIWCQVLAEDENQPVLWDYHGA